MLRSGWAPSPARGGSAHKGDFLRYRAPTAAAVIALAAATLWVSPAGAQAELPDGPGKAALTEACTQCHDLGTVTAQHRSAEEWTDVIDRMEGFGASLSDAKRADIAAYLNANLGKGDATAPATPPAPVAAPSPGARSR